MKYKHIDTLCFVCCTRCDCSFTFCAQVLCAPEAPTRAFTTDPPVCGPRDTRHFSVGGRWCGCSEGANAIAARSNVSATITLRGHRIASSSETKAPGTVAAPNGLQRYAKLSLIGHWTLARISWTRNGGYSAAAGPSTVHRDDPYLRRYETSEQDFLVGGPFLLFSFRVQSA